MEGFLKEVRFVCMANIRNEETSSMRKWGNHFQWFFQFNIVSPTYLPVPHPQFQTTMEQNIKKKKKSRKFQKAKPDFAIHWELFNSFYIELNIISVIQRWFKICRRILCKCYVILYKGFERLWIFGTHCGEQCPGTNHQWIPRDHFLHKQLK